MIRIRFLLAILYVFIITPLSAQTDNTGLSDTIPIAPEITKGTFKNGLTFYIRKNVKPENRAQLHLVVNAGSVLEDDDQQGLAHFCEHMAFNGTKHFEKNELVNYLESIGMKFGPEINAYTSFDETVYMLQVPTDTAGVMDTAFQILEDWARYMSFDHEEIDKERGVVIEEWRLGRGADSRLYDKHLPVLFKDSRYASRLPIGKKAVLDTFHYDATKKFYRDWYRPDLMAVIAVGDFDPNHVKTLIENHFASIPAADNPRERVLYPVPDHTEPLFTIATDPEATRSVVRIYFKHDVHANVTVADYRKGFIESIYNSMLNARLQEISQQANPPFLYGYSSDGRLVRTKGTYYLAASVKDNGLMPGLEALLTESNRLYRFGFTESELERAKKEVLRYMDKLNKERDKIESISFAREYARNFLEDEPIPGIVYENQLAVKYVNGIQLQEVNQLSQEWLTRENRVIRIDAPEKEGISVPTKEELLALFNSVEAKELEPYIDNVSDKPLISEMPQPGKIVDEKVIDDIDVTVFTLSNGIKVYCKPTDFKNDEIQFNAFSYGGDGYIDEENYIPAATATSVITEGGVGDFNLIELQKKLAGKVVYVEPWIGTVAEGVSGSASPQDIETLFQLIYLYITHPRKDTTAYYSYIDKLRGYLENRNVRPETAYSDTLQLTLGNYHYRSHPWSMDMIQKMDLEKSFEFYQERFADVDDMTFFFVGNLDLDAIKKLSTTYLTALPSRPGDETWTDPGEQMPDDKIDKAVYSGMEPKSLVSIVFHGDFQWSKQNQYNLAALGDLLRIQLRKVVREDMGGTYGIRVSPSTSRIPDKEFKLTISFGCKPERVNELTNTILSEISSIQSSTPDEEYLLKIKETDLRELEVNLQKNGYWLSNMFSYYMDGLPVSDLLDYKARVEKLTAKDIQQTAIDLIDINNYIRVVLYPKDLQKN